MIEDGELGLPEMQRSYVWPAPQGSRDVRSLLVASHAVHDPEHTDRCTLKRYESEKVAGEGGTWRHTRITLKLVSPDFEPIVLTPEDEGTVHVVAGFVEVIREAHQ